MSKQDSLSFPLNPLFPLGFHVGDQQGVAQCAGLSFNVGSSWSLPELTVSSSLPLYHCWASCRLHDAPVTLCHVWPLPLSGTVEDHVYHLSEVPSETGSFLRAETVSRVTLFPRPGLTRNRGSVNAEWMRSQVLKNRCIWIGKKGQRKIICSNRSEFMMDS